MNRSSLFLGTFLILQLLLTACSPVKFTKSNDFVVSPQCTASIGCGNGGAHIECNPKINSVNDTFTYAIGAGAFPSITSNCAPSNNDYQWTVKRADSGVVTSSIPGLSGNNPQNVNFTGLGPGTYYVYLTATQTGSVYSPFVATTPLEFIVMGAGVGNTLTCDPKLNQTFTNLVINTTDANAQVSANCNPAAGMYTWTVVKDGQPIVIAGLSGSVSAPDIKSYGAGVYQISLYAASPSSQHWQSTTPLTVTIKNPPPPMTPVACAPRINGTMTTLIMNSATANPLVSANCLPASADYTWTATRNGTAIAVPGLMGANANPDFHNLGVGTYLIYLTASQAGYATWYTTTPLVVTVTAPSNNLALNCAPRLNTTAVTLTIPTTGANPVVTSNCNPASAATNWIVFRNGTQVTVPGLAGASSTPQLIGMGLGTYYIYLTATSPGYNAYVSPTPLEVTISTTMAPVRTVESQRVVQATDNKVDVLVVVDDSSSMLPDNKKLAARMQGFVTGLANSGMDWQMCATVTHSQQVNSNDPTYYWGATRFWSNFGKPVLNSSAADPNAVFTQTIDDIGAGWENTNDERAIKAAWWNIEYSPYNQCHRPDSALAVVILSDEDERSVGGNAADAVYTDEYQPLEADDQPFGLITKIKQTFGITKKFTVNSIIVKPTDAACMATQDAEGSKSHYGFKYQELSQLTDGHIGSICDADFTESLYYFKDKIVNSLASIPLECAVATPITVNVTPAVAGLRYQLENNRLIFSPAIPVGRTLTVRYDCPQN